MDKLSKRTSESFSDLKGKAYRNNIDEFNAEIKAYRNYAVAKYQAKEKIFLQQLSKMDEKRFANHFEQFKGDLKNAIEEYGIKQWNDIIKQLEGENGIVEILEGQKGRLDAIYRLKEVKGSVKIPKWMLEEIKNGVSSWEINNKTNEVKITGSGQFYESMLGLLYEKFIMTTIVKNAVGEVATTGIQGVYNSLIKNLFHAGNIRGPQALRSFGDILYDVMVDTQYGGYDKSALYSNDSILTYSDRVVSINQEIELTYDKIQKDILYNQTNEDLLDVFKSSNLYGFGIKKYNIMPGTGDAHKFSSSSPLQNSLNQKFQKTKPKTWNAIYAWGYVQTQVNKHILDIVGPNSVGQFFGNMFLWTSDFIGNTLFTMQVRGEGGFVEREDHGKKFTEIHPVVPTSEIYFRYLAGRKITSITANKKNYEYTDDNNILQKGAKVNIRANYTRK